MKGRKKKHEIAALAVFFVFFHLFSSSSLTLSNPTGPRLDLTMLATAVTAVTFCERTSEPVVREPCSARPEVCGANIELFFSSSPLLFFD